jgi:hypothetical protein
MNLCSYDVPATYIPNCISVTDCQNKQETQDNKKFMKNLITNNDINVIYEKELMPHEKLTDVNALRI